MIFFKNDNKGLAAKTLNILLPDIDSFLHPLVLQAI
jgi:hypothetical protein